MYDVNLRLSFRGRVISQAVSSRPFTENARLRFRAELCDIRGAQSGIGTVSSAHFGLPFGIITPTLHTRLHPSTTFIGKTNGRNLVNLKPSSVSNRLQENAEEKSSLPLSC